MPESFPVWFPWLLGALTGGLSAAIFNSVMNWQKAENDKKREKTTQINALKQELLHALWLIGYNHDRIDSKELPNKALTPIGTANVERHLFETTSSLSIKPEIQSKLHDYLQQTVYLNSLIAEYIAAVSTNPLTPNRFGVWLGEIKAICTLNDTYRDNDPEPSLRVRVKKLLDDLSEVKL
jgi:hypothetical protein